MFASDRRLVVAPGDDDPGPLQVAAVWILSGRVVAYPTDTFYGLAVDPSSPEAVAALFALKGRAAEMAVPLVAASLEQVEESFGRLTGQSEHLARVFWPGPLSLILDAPTWMAPAVLGGGGTAAVRVPDHAVARQLAAAVGRPITATSANPSGAPPARHANDLQWLAAGADVLLLDGGVTRGGLPSTLVDARGATPRCLRAGAIAWDRVLTSG